jgi:hypothetical protein
MFYNNQIMLFWRKDKAKEIRDDLKSVKNKTENLKKFEEKLDKTKSMLHKIKSNIKEAEKDILARAAEEKSRPWIDQKYDSDIDSMAENEVRALKQLESDMEEYVEMVVSLKDEKDLDAAINLLKEEESKIVKREEENEKKINKMATETINTRMGTPSDSSPAISTSDGTPWSDILYVSRQLGGWLVGKGNHPAAIYFPHHKRPIPVSSDVGTDRIAGQIIEQLKNFFPTEKVPNKHNLVNALKKGDIRHAA